MLGDRLRPCEKRRPLTASCSLQGLFILAFALLGLVLGEIAKHVPNSAPFPLFEDD